jgi:hypothetical protein
MLNATGRLPRSEIYLRSRPMVTISRLEAQDLIKASKGRIFTTVHTKKDKTQRVTNCRTGVKKGVTGEGMKYSPADYNLIPVYDMQHRGFRMVNIDTLATLVIDKTTYTIEGM